MPLCFKMLDVSYLQQLGYFMFCLSFGVCGCVSTHSKGKLIKSVVAWEGKNNNFNALKSIT